MKRQTASVLALVFVVTAVAQSASGSVGRVSQAPHAVSPWDAKILRVYYKDRRKLGSKAVGRNIVIRGVHVTGHTGRPATHHEKAKFLHQLRRLAHPAPPYLVRVATAPRNDPAGTMAAGVAPSGLAQCIVHYESGGNSQAVNGIYEGIAQWDHNAWVADGGTKYSSTPLGASYQQQVIVLSNGLARYGCSQWCPYDPC